MLRKERKGENIRHESGKETLGDKRVQRGEGDEQGNEENKESKQRRMFENVTMTFS